MKKLNRDYTGDGSLCTKALHRKTVPGVIPCGAQRTVPCVILLLLTLTLTLTGCKKADRDGQQETKAAAETTTQDSAQTAENGASGDMTDMSEGWTGETGWQGETASDGSVDIAAMQALNPDIFGWIYVPGTRIDLPVLRSIDDLTYETHNALGEADDAGAVFTEMANLPDMCDFNEVLHGTAAREEDPFYDLSSFLDPGFFDSHREAYVYIDGNRLTYEIFAAYRRKNTSLLRLYDFSYEDGCRQFVTDLLMSRDMSTQFRTGSEDINPYHFLITLTGHVEGRASEGNEISQRIAQGESDTLAEGEQIVVLGVLIDDAAGMVDRNMNATDLYYELLDD